jgi:hypothetical protein
MSGHCLLVAQDVMACEESVPAFAASSAGEAGEAAWLEEGT